MNDACTARIRPFLGDTEVTCELTGGHEEHRGTVRDYAGPGSRTIVGWFETDRRNFHGDWPGRCSACTLPVGHRGRHAP
jgi:hypothetical protein